MAKVKKGAVLARLSTLFNVGTIRELTDGQLLERFATECSEVAELAFAVLVERHGAMVMRVCRSLLADQEDARDAFQATFLVLFQKARGLWVRDSLGPWLHTVAYRTASCARATSARRRRHERNAAALRIESHDQVVDELSDALHEEIERLPEYFRVPVVLCELEGRSHEQAARHLGWPLGTVKSRLARGRDRLRNRLTRRGLDPVAGLLPLARVPQHISQFVPPALVESTTRAVVELAAARLPAGAAAAVLARGVLKSLALARWSKVAAVALCLGASVPAAFLVVQKQIAGVEAARKSDVPVFEVKPGQLRVTIRAFGSIEAARTASSYCQVEKETVPAGVVKILSIVPDATKVTKGQIVCQLDSGALEDALIAQKMTVKNAEANAENAALAREVAELGVKDYIAANPNQDTLKLKELRSELEKARSDELAKKATAQLEQAKATKYRKLIESCTYRASIAGVVVHGNDSNRLAGRAGPQIQQGKTVREGQLIFRIFDLDGPMQAIVKLPEEDVNKVNLGSRAEVIVDALGPLPLAGRVVSIAPLPDAANIFANAETKRYTTTITIEKPPAALRPGMLAHADILIEQLEGVFAVPVESVLDFDGKAHVAAQQPGGRFEWREVTRGLSNGTLVELKAGVHTGDRIALKALSLWNKPTTKP
jgi:RNA polymerase sigma factor (sigma-70 family)